MYTNIDNHGGDFRDVLNREFTSAQNVTIASGYMSLDILHAYEGRFNEIASNGGVAKLLLGMAFYEGLSQKKLDAALILNRQLLTYNNGSGVYVTNGRKYHGKIYHFYDEINSNIYVGSSNFSSSGTSGNIECTLPVIINDQKESLTVFLNDLFSRSYSITIEKAEITVPGVKKVVLQAIENNWNEVPRYNPLSIEVENLPKFEFPLDRIVVKEKSNLNVYFGKGRLNTSTGKIAPRPWYEIELIANKELNSMDIYPKGDFLAFTDDGYVLEMSTQGDYYKNIRSKNSLQIFGIWLKGKLERKGALRMYEPVTLETLEEYGNNKLTLYKMDEGKYYMEF